MYEPMPSMLTSRGFRVGYAVFCVLYGVFNLYGAIASGRRTPHIVLGLFWLALGVFWGIGSLPRKKARR
ncbi:MAG TPA: hypothetical protein VGE89_10305 [Bryobacteraceae bacterium]|jgi:hypothetical protein